VIPAQFAKISQQCVKRPGSTQLALP